MTPHTPIWGEVLTPGPQNETVFEDGDFTEVNYIKMWPLGWALIPMTGVLTERGNLDRHRGKIKRRDTEREKIAIERPRRKVWNRPSPHGPWKEPAFQTPRLAASRAGKSARWWHLVRAALGS